MSSVAIGFIVYLLIIFTVGVLTARLNKSLPDYLLAGRRLGPWVVAFSERASAESGWMLLGLTGLAYASGLGDPSGTRLEPALWTGLGGVAGVIAAWILVAKRLRQESERLGALTIPRFFELRFRGQDTTMRFAATGIIGLMGGSSPGYEYGIGDQFLRALYLPVPNSPHGLGRTLPTGIGLGLVHRCPGGP